MEDFRHNYVNLTGFRLVMYDSPMVRDIVRQMRLYEKHSGVKLLNGSNIIKVCPIFPLAHLVEVIISCQLSDLRRY